MREPIIDMLILLKNRNDRNIKYPNFLRFEHFRHCEFNVVASWQNAPYHYYIHH